MSQSGQQIGILKNSSAVSC